MRFVVQRLRDYPNAVYQIKVLLTAVQFFTYSSFLYVVVPMTQSAFKATRFTLLSSSNHDLCHQLSPVRPSALPHF